MQVIDVLDGTQILRLSNEVVSFFGKNGIEVELEATREIGDLLVAARSDAKGKMWLGGWRRQVHPCRAGQITLKPIIRYSDSLGRRASTTSSHQVVRAYNSYGQVPVHEDKEMLIVSRQFPAFVVPRKWLKSRGKRKKLE